MSSITKMEEQYEYSASCGGKRRGCCIIMPSNDCDNQRNLVLFLELSDGRPSHWTMVSLPIAETPGELGETIG
jgi:hypothetical protein